MPNVEDAVRNLIRNGWSDDDIQSTIKGMEDHTKGLIQAGKSDEEIESTLSQTKILDKQGNPFQLFQNPGKQIVDEGLSNVPVSAANSANKVLQQDTVQAKDVKDPSFLQNLAAGPVGTIGEGIVRKLTPLPGLTRAIEGTSSKDLNVAGAILPEAIPDTFKFIVDNVKKISPDFGKLIEDTVAASPAFHGAIGRGIKQIPNTVLYKGGKAPVDVSKLRNVGPDSTPTNLGKIDSVAPSVPATQFKAPSGPDVKPAVQTSIVGQPAAILPQTGAPANIPDPNLINLAIQTRDYGIKFGSQDIINKSNKILDDAGIPELERVLPPESIEAKGNTQVAIEVAATAKKFAEEIDDPVLLKRAIEIVNNNGIIRPLQIQNPSIHDLENFTADINIIGNRKPELDMTKLEGTKVVNPDGTPLKLYHGSAAVFDEFKIDKAKPGLFGTGIYLTDEPKIAGGNVSDPITEIVNGKTITRHETSPHFGYAEPRLPANRVMVDPKEIEEHYKPGKIVEGYAGIDKVISFNKLDPKNPYMWSVTVQGLNPETLQPLKGDQGRPRTHSTAPYSQSVMSPNVRPAYVNIKNPFDIDGPLNFEQAKQIMDIVDPTDPAWKNSIDIRNQINRFADDFGNIPNEWQTDGRTLYDYIDAVLAGGDLKTVPKDRINDVLKQAGYDGITHIGGAITGNAPHRVYIAFDPSQVVSKFDPKLYSFRMRDNLNNEYIEKNGAIVKQAVTKPEELAGDIDGDIPRDLLDIKNADDPILTRANQLGITAELQESDIAPSADPLQGMQSRLGNPIQPPTPPNPTVTNNPVPVDPTLDIQATRKFIPFHRIAAKIENETGIPVLTEFYDKGREAHYSASKMESDLVNPFIKEMNKIAKFGRSTQFYIEGQKHVTRALKMIASYDKRADLITWKDANSNIHTDSPSAMSRATGYTIPEVKVAALAREWYDNAFQGGSPTGPNFHREYYSPKRALHEPEDRFDYIESFRKGTTPYYRHKRTGAIYPEEERFLTLMRGYAREWAKVTHLLPWQKQTAEPILAQIETLKSATGAKSTTLEYLTNHVHDLMGNPRQTAQDFNFSVNKFVDNFIEPRLGKKIADDIRNKFGDERMGEGGSQWIANNTYSGFMAYRPVPMLRNYFEPLLSLPLLPNGVSDLRKGGALLRDPRNIDRVLAMQAVGFLSDDIPIQGQQPTNPTKVLSMNIVTGGGGFKAVENKNRGRIAIVQHNNLIQDFHNGMSTADMKAKYRLHLLPKPVGEKIERLYSQGKVGDVLTNGLNDNAAAYLGNWTQHLSMKPYQKGGGLEVFKSGPVAKQFGVFQTWSPMTIDYLINVMHDTVKGPATKMDTMRIAKMLGYFFAIDYTSEQLTGYSLMTNPISNIPTRMMGAPAPSALAALQQGIAGEWNNLLNDITSDKENKWMKWMTSKAWSELTRQMPGFVPGGYGARDIYKAVNPKEDKKPKSIGQ